MNTIKIIYYFSTFKNDALLQNNGNIKPYVKPSFCGELEDYICIFQKQD